MYADCCTLNNCLNQLQLEFAYVIELIFSFAVIASSFNYLSRDTNLI